MVGGVVVDTVGAAEEACHGETHKNKKSVIDSYIINVLFT